MYITEKAPKGQMLTYTGKFFDPLDPNPDDISIVDIAHALANISRYNGHVDHFYSVAQHSALVSEQFPYGSELRKWGLLHDASEAYIGDLIAPLKYLPQFEFYLEAEIKLMNVITDKFGLPNDMPKEVHDVDIKLRGAEMRDLKNYFPEESEGTYGFTIRPWLPSYARSVFMNEAFAEGLATKQEWNEIFVDSLSAGR